jgi:serine/threonine-protein kinase ULK2
VHEGVFKICDFGFAKYFGEGGKMAKTCVGTPIYMSPQVLKQKNYSNKTDIWSLGVVYYELLFGRLPFVGKSEDEIFKQINRGQLAIPKCTEFSYEFIKNTLVVE